jgi:hypothetical protein
MVEVTVKPQWKRAALKEAEEMGSLKKSITKGAGNQAGFIGERVVADYLGVKKANTYQYDLVNGQKEKTYDVKTKRCKFKPLPNYTVSVCALNTRQDCDAYVFVRVDNEMKNAWILGYMPKEQFFKKAKFCKKGDIDPDSNCNWRFREDCYNMYIKDLKNINDLKVKPAKRKQNTTTKS